MPVVVDGVNRSFRLYRPHNVGALTPVPLLLVLSSYGHDATTIENDTGFDDLADRKGFVVAYPDSLDKAWNAGVCCFVQPRTPTDPVPVKSEDVALLDRVIDRVSELAQVDQSRVYVAGFSNGAMMALRYACERSERVSGVASVAGTLETTCQATRPVSSLHLAGLQDTTIPFAGSPLSALLKAPLAPVPTAVAAFESLNQCSGLPVRSSTSVLTLRSFPICAQGTSVELGLINGGGHQWPTLKNVRYDASGAIWDFFLAHPRTPDPGPEVVLPTQIVASVNATPTGKRLAGYLDGRYDMVIGAPATLRIQLGQQWQWLADLHTDYSGRFSVALPTGATAVEIRFLTPSPGGPTATYPVD